MVIVFIFSYRPVQIDLFSVQISAKVGEFYRQAYIFHTTNDSSVFGEVIN